MGSWGEAASRLTQVIGGNLFHSTLSIWSLTYPSWPQYFEPFLLWLALVLLFPGKWILTFEGSRLDPHIFFLVLGIKPNSCIQDKHLYQLAKLINVAQEILSILKPVALMTSTNVFHVNLHIHQFQELGYGHLLWNRWDRGMALSTLWACVRLCVSQFSVIIKMPKITYKEKKLIWALRNFSSWTAGPITQLRKGGRGWGPIYWSLCDTLK